MRLKDNIYLTLGSCKYTPLSLFVQPELGTRLAQRSTSALGALARVVNPGEWQNAGWIDGGTWQLDWHVHG